MEIKFTIHYTKELSVRLWTLFFLNYFKGPLVLGFLISAVFAYFTFIEKITIFAILLVITLMFLIVPVSQYFNKKRLLRKKSSNSSKQDMDYVITDDEIIVKSALTSKVYKWKSFYKILRTKEYMFLVQRGPVYLPVTMEKIEDEDLEKIYKHVYNAIKIKK